MSVTITIDLANITRPEVLAVQTILREFDTHAMQERIAAGDFTDETIQEAATRLANKEAERRPIPSQLPVSVDLSAPGRVEEKAPANEPEAPKAKRGRPRKEATQEVAAEPVDPTPASSHEPTEATAPVEPAGSSAEVSTPPTLDALRSALMSYTDRHDVDTGLALLQEFGAARVSELAGLPVEKQIEFMEKANG